MMDQIGPCWTIMGRAVVSEDPNRAYISSCYSAVQSTLRVERVLHRRKNRPVCVYMEDGVYNAITSGMTEHGDERQTGTKT